MLFRSAEVNSVSKQAIDTLIHARWVIPVVPSGAVLEQHSIAIHNKKIIALCPTANANERYTAEQEFALDTHAVIPGLVNTHGHSPMVLLRGIADDVPLQEWLEQRIWPLEGKFVSREFVQQGTSLAMAEMIASGTTTFADNYFFPDEVAKVAQHTQMRVQLACPVLDFPTAWAQDADEYIRKATQLHDDFRTSDFVYTAFGPHAPYTVSDGPLEKIVVLADELDIPIHMHVHENAKEVSDAVASDGRRPIKRLHELGLISPRMVCVHATQLVKTEMELLAELGANVVHCPESNLKLASGFCETAKLKQHGVNTALGTDGGASNNDLDMFGEMQTAAMLAKAVAEDASALPAHEALEMATINGARAMGMDSFIGSLEVDKFADITAVDMDALNTLPMHNPLSHLVYACKASQVSHVWCGGRLLYQDGELQTLDVIAIKQQASQWLKKMAGA